MSLLPSCVVCDALLRPYTGDCVCDRCKEPCRVCGKGVANCRHPLPVPYTPISFDTDPETGNPRIAA